MKFPSKRGTPIDQPRIDGWCGVFHGYREVVSAQKIISWLDQFSEKDRDLASRILDAVIFIKLDDIDIALKECVENVAGRHIDESRRKGKWRFVACSGSPGESGDTMIHRLRTKMGLSRAKHSDLFIYKSDLTREKFSASDTLVFVDDFAGTGKQVTDAWTTIFEELIPEGPKVILVLVAASSAAIEKISSSTRFEVVAGQVLGCDDDVFSNECIQFQESEKKILLRYCKRADRHKPKGFGNCGLLIVLSHNTPNNSIPILHATNKVWTGIFPRYA